MSDLILSLVATGTPEHPRFLIADPNENFWTGEDWSDEETDGCLFASVNDAGQTVQEILLAQHGDKPMRRFVAPVYVDVFSDTNLTQDQIKEWLVKVARLTMDAEAHGNGPVDDSLGLTLIDWNKLREIKAEE